VAFSEQDIVLGVLNEVQRDSTATQRQIAGNLGIALGLTNACLKRCVKKGLVKVTQVPANRYLYYLTPAGFAEKSRLAADYLGQSFHFYRTARGQCLDIMEQAVSRGLRRIALAGASDLAEIMALCADGRAELVAVIDPAASRKTLAGVKVVRNLDEAGQVSAVIITALQGAQGLFEHYRSVLGTDRVLAPPLLGVSNAPCIFSTPVCHDDPVCVT
jgi:DNA-binding MarR family transcriptional regulator